VHPPDFVSVSAPYWSEGIRTDIRKAPLASVTQVSVRISVRISAGWPLSVGTYG